VNIQSHKRDRHPARRHFVSLAIVWTLLVLVIYAFAVHNEREAIIDTAGTAARTAYEKDIVYRNWAAIHGGVYVPVSEAWPPNPYLDSPERDITTPSGRALTLVNPAYMTRQVHEIFVRKTGIRTRLTSLAPLNPHNAPDDWEREALSRIADGAAEVSGIDSVAGTEVFRLMGRLVTEESCLACHAKQGYRLGDVRGGISVSLPMAPYWAVLRGQIARLSLTGVFVWLAGLGGLGLSTRRIGREMRRRAEAEAELLRSNEQLETTVSDRTRALRMLSACNLALVRAEDEDDLFRELCRIIVETGGFRMAWVGLALPDETKSVRPAAWHGIEDGYLENLGITWADTERGRGPVGTAIRTGRPVVCRDFQTDPALAPWREAAAKRGYASMIAMPLLAGQNALGALAIYSDKPDAFDENEAGLLLELADDLAFGIRALRTRAERDAAHEQLAEAYADVEQQVLERTRELSDAIAALRREVAERERAEAALRKSQAILTETNRLARIGAWEYDIPGKRLTWTEEVFRLHEADPSFVPDTESALAFFPQDDRETLTRAVKQTSETGEPFDLELALITAKGNRRFVRALGRAELGQGRPVRLVGSFQDITQAKELERLREDVERIVRHDLKSPLNAIIGLPQVLLQAENLSEEQREFIGHIEESGLRMLNMINLSLSIYRIEAGTYEFTPVRVDLVPLLSRIAGEAGLASRHKRVGVRVLLRGRPVLPGDAFHIPGDELLCYSMLANLVLNAVEASPAQGEVRVDLSEDGGFAAIGIHNSGTIPPEMRGRFFKKFATAGKKGGTGLGTYSAKLIAKTHGGDIAFTTSPEAGTVVTIRLPRP
jgi:signal transduction histidine kinase/GAF domain-containing protein